MCMRHARDDAIRGTMEDTDRESHIIYSLQVIGVIRY